MKLFNQKSALEIALVQVEACMEQQGIKIVNDQGGLHVMFQGNTHRTIDTDLGGDYCLQQFPRQTEGERVVVSEE